MTIGAPIASAPASVPAPNAAKVPAAIPPPTLEERVAELNVYAESGDAVADGEIWYVEETADVFGKDGLGFDDILDIINPLHHIPVVGTLYRAITGDELAPAPRVMGGALFGGVIGFAAALVNAIIDEATGSDIGDKALALFTGDKPAGDRAGDVAGDGGAAAVAVAAAGPAVAGRAPTTAATAVAQPTAKAAAHSAPAIESNRPIASNPALAAFLADRSAGAKSAKAVNAQPAGNGQIPPSEALIRARSAVPAARKAAALGFGGAAARTAAHSQRAANSIIPAASAAPAAGKTGHPVSKPAFPSVVSNHPARYTAAAHHSAAKAAPDPAPRYTATRTEATPPGDIGSVPMLMQQALEKYEVLMQARSSPTLEDEI